MLYEIKWQFGFALPRGDVAPNFPDDALLTRTVAFQYNFPTTRTMISLARGDAHRRVRRKTFRRREKTAAVKYACSANERASWLRLV